MLLSVVSDLLCDLRHSLAFFWGQISLYGICSSVDTGPMLKRRCYLLFKRALGMEMLSDCCGVLRICLPVFLSSCSWQELCSVWPASKLTTNRENTMIHHLDNWSHIYGIFSYIWQNVFHNRGCFPCSRNPADVQGSGLIFRQCLLTKKDNTL